MAADAKTIVSKYIDAYNAVDLDALSQLLGSDVVLQHHNNTAEPIRGRDAVIDLVGTFAKRFPGRGFKDRTRMIVDGGVVAVQHTWSGVAAEDMPGYAEAGQAVTADFCTVFEVVDGLVVQYDDYG